MPSSPVRAAAVLGLAASLLFLFGCGDDEPATDAASPTPAAAPTSASPPASPTPTPTPAPKQIKASNNFDKITVTGGYGKEPKVKVEAPWAIEDSCSCSLVISSWICSLSVEFSFAVTIFDLISLTTSMALSMAA